MARLSLSKYLAASHQARAYVHSHMPVGAHDSGRNMLAKLIVGNIYTRLAVDSTRAEIDQELARRKAAGPMPPSEWDAFYIETMAAAALRSGAGNCGEQSALAFKFLKDHGIRPLDYVKCVNRDHAIVILGAIQPIRPDNF